MKIIRFTAENVKRIRLVDIRPDGSLVQITGANGSGKSSVLDAILWALAGAKGVDLKPVRAGEEQGMIRLDLGDLVVTRTFSADGTTKLKIEDAASGAVYQTPQKILDELAAKFTFDPFEFARLAPKAQVDALKRLVPLDVDIDALDAQNRADFENRTAVNRRAKALHERVNTLFAGIDPAADVTPIDTAAQMDEIQSASERNVGIETERARRRSIAKQAEINRDDAAAKRRTAEAMIRAADALDRMALGYEEEIQKAGDLPDATDISAVRRKFEDAERENANKALQRQHRAAHAQAKTERDAAVKEADDLTAAMDARTAQKTAAIAGAKMPIQGLSFGDGELLLNGLPFAQASSAEQLRASIGIAMASNPKLRVLRIKDGSLLDEASVALVEEMAEGRDYQVWLERVDTSGRVGIVMEDGTARVAAHGESADVEEGRA